MSVKDCVFCRMAKGRIAVTKVYEDQVVLAFLDIAPVTDGHTLVIPKQHFEKLHDCPGELLSEVTLRLSKIAKAVSEAVDSDGYNVLCNNGSAAGQVVGHLHFHIVPRRTGDGLFEHWPSYTYPAGTAEQIAAKICKNLQY